MTTLMITLTDYQI